MFLQSARCAAASTVWRSRCCRLPDWIGDAPKFLHSSGGIPKRICFFLHVCEKRGEAVSQHRRSRHRQELYSTADAPSRSLKTHDSFQEMKRTSLLFAVCEQRG